MRYTAAIVFIVLLAALLALPVVSVWAGYKPRSWTVGTRDSYPAQLTSEGVTIAVQPFFTDKMAAQAFDKNDMVTRGIMPLAVIIFNDNDFPVQIDGVSIEVTQGRDQLRTVRPEEAVARLFRKEKSWLPQPIPRGAKADINTDALYDFEAKFLLSKIVEPHDQGVGFLYLPVRNPTDLTQYLSGSSIYIPNIYRLDNSSRMIFFEIPLDAALKQ